MPTRSKFLAIALTGSLALGACTGSQPAQQPVAKTATQAAAAAPGSQASGGDAQNLTAERIMQLQREGYKLVDRNGQTYFCRTEAKTGSHLAHETVCMTEAEITALREQTQRGLGRVMRERPPPQGN